MKMQKINRKNGKKHGKKHFPAFLERVSRPKKGVGLGKNGEPRIKWPLFSEMELLFSKNVVSFADDLFFFLTKNIPKNNERK
jgi:hypothetical protein